MMLALGGAVTLGDAHPRHGCPAHALARRRLLITATAYCSRGMTASGTRARYGIIAADTRVLPMGAIVHVQGYGVCRVGDTGGAIKGHRIDVHLATTQACKAWGRRQVVVTVLSMPSAPPKRRARRWTGDHHGTHAPQSRPRRTRFRLRHV
jgi:3D (Asp-Asp-Asp) domain-containing protein